MITRIVPRPVLANIALLFVLLCFELLAWAQTTVVLPEGTEVTLRLLERLDSRYSQVGNPVYLAVGEDILVNGHTVIAAGDSVIGTVTVAKPASALGMPGQLDFVVPYLSVNGQNVRLRVFATRREGEGGALIFPFQKGRNVSIEQGALFRVYVDQDKVINKDILFE